MSEIELSNTGVFAALGTPHLPPGPQMLAEAAASARMLEDDRELSDYDPTPWCSACGARKRENCHCGPIAENN